MVSMIELDGDHCLIRSPVLLLVVDFLFIRWYFLRACMFVRLRWLSTICFSAALEAPAAVTPKDLPF